MTSRRDVLPVPSKNGQTPMLDTLKLLVASSDLPTVSDTELNAILDRSGGNLNYAAMLAWELKAAKSATLVDFTSDGSTFSRSQFLKHAQAMRAMYANKLAATLPVR